MARYIDADKFAKRIEVSPAFTNMGFEGQFLKNIVLDLLNNVPTADVVPKSEVDNWYQLYHSIKEELKQEKMYHRETENLCDRYCIESQQAKNQVARQIFEEIESIISPMLGLEDDKEYVAILTTAFSEIKKKYTEEK